MSDYITLAGADHPPEKTGAIIVRNNMLLASLLAQEFLPARLLIIATAETSGPDADMIEVLSGRPYVLLTFDYREDEKDADLEWLVEWDRAIPIARPSPWLNNGCGLPPERLFTRGAVTAWFAMVLHCYILTTREAAGDRLANLQAENKHLRGYLDSATTMLMIERNAQAGHRLSPS